MLTSDIKPSPDQSSSPVRPTVVETAPVFKDIPSGAKITLLGSCFACEIGNYLTEAGLDILNNPFGVLYNPASIAQSIDRLLGRRPFGEEDVIPRDTNPVKSSTAGTTAECSTAGSTSGSMVSRGTTLGSTIPGGTASGGMVLGGHRQIAPEGGGYVSFYHHGSFARKTPAEFLSFANDSLAKTAEHFTGSSHIIITFGTAGVFRHIGRDMIVSNCHKHPAQEFRRERLEVDDIVRLWSPILERLGDKHFIFTVSPIRYRVDGMHGNSISKSILLLAIEQLCKKHPNASYFPAYEIVMDELRDYRWFAADGIHPSPEAVSIVCHRFLGR